MDFIGVLISSILEFVIWVVWAVIIDVLPVVFYFTALALLFTITFGRITVEFPHGVSRVGWTGFLKITRSTDGRMILSPPLGVIAGFVIWTVVVGAVIIVHAYRA